MLTRNPRKLRRPRPSFLPTDLQGLLAWYDASRLTGLADGGDVGTFPDLSRNGRDATQGTAAAKPHFRTGQINGLPSVDFDATDDVLPLPSSPVSGHPVCLFIVLIPRDVLNYIYWVTTDDRQNTYYGHWFGISGSDSKMSIGFGDGQGVEAGNRRSGLGSTVLSAGTAYALTYQIIGATNQPMWVNGVAETVSYSGTGLSIAFSGAPGRIGTDGGQLDEPTDADIGEVILLDQIPSTEDRIRTENYLMRKWRI